MVVQTAFSTRVVEEGSGIAGAPQSPGNGPEKCAGGRDNREPEKRIDGQLTLSGQLITSARRVFKQKKRRPEGRRSGAKGARTPTLDCQSSALPAELLPHRLKSGCENRRSGSACQSNFDSDRLLALGLRGICAWRRHIALTELISTPEANARSHNNNCRRKPAEAGREEGTSPHESSRGRYH